MDGANMNAQVYFSSPYSYFKLYATIITRKFNGRGGANKST